MINKCLVLCQDRNNYNTVVLKTDKGLKMAVILPNWNIKLINGREYYLELTQTLAGETSYVDEYGNTVYHKYTNLYITKAVENEIKEYKPEDTTIKIINDLELCNG